MNSVGNLSELSLHVPRNKYSSTESELSSDDDNISDYVTRLSLSAVSTSTASSSTAATRFRRKRHKSRQGSISCSSSSATMFKHEHVATSSKKGDSSTDSFSLLKTVNRKSRIWPAVTSTSDLKHAIGRHRGISGSCFPALDVALFAMFYVNDTFDDLLIDACRLPLRETFYESARAENKQISLKRDLLSILRKEIVYSLRTNYFCPASKITKLVNLVKPHYPTDRLQDAGAFFGLLFQDALSQQPFLTYSNGLSSCVYKLDLACENYSTRKYYHNQAQTVTIQQLLYQRKALWRKAERSKDNKNGESLRAVPYPTLILQKIPDVLASNPNPSQFKNFAKSSTNNFHVRHSLNKLVIPNLTIDVTDMIAGSSTNKKHHGHKRYSFWKKSVPIEEEFDALYSDQFNLNLIDKGTAESLLSRGFKSVWNFAYKYIEDLAASSSYVDPHDSHSLALAGNEKCNTSEPIRIRDPTKDEWANTQRFKSSNDDISQLSSSVSSISSFRSHKNDFDECYSKTTGSNVFEVKMELISIICKSRKSTNATYENNEEHCKVISGYSVYCKAGKDVFIEGEQVQFAPWIFYQSRIGVSPQVLLIENFGKWVNSLEKHHQNLSMEEVPLEIRRVLEDSYLFIYKRII